MDDTAKYLIHAAITADGVVERSDVVGAIFGQTEGLLGDDLDLRDLQQSSKVGRIDVEIDSENGQSYGEVTIASSLDKVETSILAASLETIARVGPCQASVEVTQIEDVRAAKRREVVDRAKELLSHSFDETVMTSREILEEVREAVRVEDITEYHGYPAGPHVETSDAIIVVEGRADVLNLLKYGIKNAVGVEGTNVPDAVATLTQERNVTAFLDGDRGGELILRELAQVGEVDYVAFAPHGRSVEDLARHEVMSALREKVPYETLSDEPSPQQAATDGSSTPAPEESVDPRLGSAATTESPATPTPVTESEGASADAEPSPAANGEAAASAVETEPETPETPDATDPDAKAGGNGAGGSDESAVAQADVADAESAAAEPEPEAEPESPTLQDHIRAVADAEGDRTRLLSDDLELVAEVGFDETFDAVVDAETVPYALVVGGELSQRVLDVAAQRGVEHVVARSTGEFVKKPIGVRVRTVDQFTVA